MWHALHATYIYSCLGCCCSICIDTFPSTNLMDSVLGVSLHLQSLSQILACVFFLYLLAGAFYRLYLSPLARFPGPKLTALTYWVELYYDLVKGGRFPHRIAQWHDQYGKTIHSSLPMTSFPPLVKIHIYQDPSSESPPTNFISGTQNSTTSSIAGRTSSTSIQGKPKALGFQGYWSLQTRARSIAIAAHHSHRISRRSPWQKCQAM